MENPMTESGSYTLVAEVGTKQTQVPFTVDFEGTVQVNHVTAQRLLNLWKDQQPEGKVHFVIRANGQVTTIYYNEHGEQVVNDAAFDGDWNIPLAWIENLIPGKVFWGNIIGQPNPAEIVKVTDAVEAVAAKFKVEDGEQWFTITDMKFAAAEAAHLALAAK
jgi:hypothetical protein